MNKSIPYFFIITIFFSCEFFDFGKKEEFVEKPIASVFNVHLYQKDIVDLLPKNVSKSDSLLMVKSIINNWAIQQLFKQKAEENLSIEENQVYTRLVDDYKQSLLINGYKERLIQQQLDTIISEEEILEYYNNNNRNFRLNEELIKIK